jgi:acyl dehydratase
MAIDASFVGRVYPPTPSYQVGRAKIREFAASIGDPNPIYHDPAVANEAGYPDVIAPPTFAIVMTLPAGDQVTKDPALGLDYSRVVHGDQRFIYQRPIVAGDDLRVVVTVESIKTVGGNDLVGLRADVLDSADRPVLSALSTLVARGSAEL